MRFAKRLSLLWHRFSPLEEQLLRAVSGVLPTQAQSILHAQISAITWVQRDPHWTEIRFYRLRHGKVNWDDVPLFPRQDEFPLAEVRFTLEGRSFKARLTSIGGHIFDFAITPSPRNVAFVTWQSEPRTQLLGDPLDTTAARVEDPVPEVWRSFVSGLGQRDANGWTLHREGETYRVTSDEGEFLVLAERAADSYLLYRLYPAPPGFFVQAGHDGSPLPLRGDVDQLIRSSP